MKKSLIVFIGMIGLCLTVMCLLPGYIMEEADTVRLTEQVWMGESSLVEGVTVELNNHSLKHLFWNTSYVAGSEPAIETEFEFSVSRRMTERTYYSGGWLNENEYGCITLTNRLNGGWHVGSNGNLALDGSNVGTRGLEKAFQELSGDTAPGEEKSRQIFIDNYMEYFPVVVYLEQGWEKEELSEEYSEFFKIPVPQSAAYTISLEKDKQGNVIGLGGDNNGNNIFFWRTVSARSETDCYFTFYRFSSDGSRMNTELIPGGFGVYRQPYATGIDGVYMDPSKLSMVYSLEEETYPYGSMFLDINAAGQLLIMTDTEDSTKLQVVDVTTMEQIQQMEFLRPEGAKSFESVIRVKDDFILLSYGGGYFALVDWNEERGYTHQFTIQVEEDDPLYWAAYVGQNDMDWNGTRLVYASCTDKEKMRASSNFMMSVYDATGKIYQGQYFSSLLTEQENSRYSYFDNKECQPLPEDGITVTWP